MARLPLELREADKLCSEANATRWSARPTCDSMALWFRVLFRPCLRIRDSCAERLFALWRSGHPCNKLASAVAFSP